jgi:hypothetical protein
MTQMMTELSSNMASMAQALTQIKGILQGTLRVEKI